MVRISEAAREEAHSKVAMLWVLRSRGGLSEDEIAKELDFEARPGLTAADAMYRWLENLKLPGWLVYPGDDDKPDRAARTGPAGGEDKDRSTQDPGGEVEWKARTAGDAGDLPPAAGATEPVPADLPGGPGRSHPPGRGGLLGGLDLADVLEEFLEQAMGAVEDGSTYPLFDDLTGDFVAEAVRHGLVTVSEAGASRGRHSVSGHEKREATPFPRTVPPALVEGSNIRP